MSRQQKLMIVCLIGLAALSFGGEARAQGPRPMKRYPLWQPTMPPGVAGEMGAMRDLCNGYYQPLRVVLPSTGEVTFYGVGGEAHVQASPGQAGILVGPLYRFKISGMPEFPGEEFYPSVELVDRLHPPPGKAAEFALPIVLTLEELEKAANGSLVTKVVYLEQPDIAIPFALTNGETALPSQPLELTRHILRQADLYGRPMALVRVGGRVVEASDLSTVPPVDFSLGIPTEEPNTKNEPGNATNDEGIVRTAHDPRVPGINCPPGEVDGFVSGPVCEDSYHLSRKYPDEYLWDGGDRRVMDQFLGEPQREIDTEDTIAQFRDINGVKRIRKSNRVSIYSPRFGSVSNETVSSERRLINGPINTMTVAADDGLRQKKGLVTNVQRSMSSRVKLRTRGSGVENSQWQSATSQKEGQGVTAETQNTYESVQRQTSSLNRRGEKAVSGELLTVVEISQLGQYPVVTGTDVSLGEVYAKTASGEVIGSFSLDKRGNLRIEKRADRTTARPGDVITFTITIRNIGDLKIEDVLVMDNLTPRLEYLPESMQTELPVNFTAEDNREGSELLTWEMTEPLKGQSEGTITFQVRVR